MKTSTQVYKSLYGDWTANCSECPIPAGWIGDFKTWAEAQEAATRHALGHESKRCEHCGRS